MYSRRRNGGEFMMYIVALYIMLKAHLKQKDKSGRMYIFHPLYDFFKLKGYNA